MMFVILQAKFWYFREVRSGEEGKAFSSEMQGSKSYCFNLMCHVIWIKCEEKREKNVKQKEKKEKNL